MAQATKAQMTRRGILGPRLIFAVALVTQLTARHACLSDGLD